ncbi:putative exported protein [Vibrio maritimus]|uniref:Putative exported protein n=1 Tax=Vibrio maritimus TaxID=990268 RepID=A0A090RTJ1_9VIBR|nr:putative exported protein [Vibrio maritimus]
MDLKKWRALVILSALPFASFASTIPDGAELTVKFELPKIQTSTYARPYVAVWIEDSNRKSVKTVQLWVGKDEWLKDLRSWWRKVGRYDRELVDAVTSATRPAGKYRFVWDGRDDNGNALPQGDYTMHIEVVREHGGRNYLRQPMTLANDNQSYQLKATPETGPISLFYQIK